MHVLLLHYLRLLRRRRLSFAGVDPSFAIHFNGRECSRFTAFFFCPTNFSLSMTQQTEVCWT
jgi:hypothetical protein